MSGILEIKRGVVDVATLNDGEFYLNKNKNTVEIGSGSAILTLVPINKTITGNIVLNGNVYANNLTGSAALSASITSTQNIGGINSGTIFSSGTDFTSLFGQLIASYQKPILSGLKLRDTSTDLTTINLQAGDYLTFNKVIITSSLENPGTNYAQNLSITASGTTQPFSVLLGNATSQNNEFNLGSLQNLIPVSIGTVTFTINGLSSTNVPLNSITTSFNYYFSNYLCASSTIISTNSTAQNIIDNDVIDFEPAGSKSWIATCTSANNDNKWTYIIYPISYGNLTSIAQGHTDVFGAFTQLTNTDTSNNIFTINNSNNIGADYYVYKSNASGAFASGVLLTIA